MFFVNCSFGLQNELDKNFEKKVLTMLKNDLHISNNDMEEVLRL